VIGRAQVKQLTVEDFTPYVDTRFVVAGGGFMLELVLAEAVARGQGRPEGRAPFILLFQGPLAPILPQATYRFEHQDLAALEIFIVPVGPEGDRMRYEAIFN
jgi:hypothetical protein